MTSESMSSSSASTVPSVLENSEYDDEQSRDSSLDYEGEQFESESADSHEATGAVVATLSSSSSDKYGSDEFEDDQEATSTVTGPTHDVFQSPDEDVYANETFEREHEPNEIEDHEATHAHLQNELGPASGNQQSAEDNQKNDGMQLDEGGNSTLKPEKAHIGIPVGTWCSKKIEDLRAASSKPTRSQPGPYDTLVSDKIPSAAVEKLIHRATSSRQPHRPQQQHRKSMPRSRHKLKTVPASLMQRAHTQLWLAKLSDNSIARQRPAKCASETQPNSPQPVLTSTFCSVKCENLRGRLATVKISETSDRWAVPEAGGLSLAALELVQSITAKQREVVSAGSDSTNEPGRRMLHQVAMTTQLQLQDSIALRQQADTLLTRR